MEIIAHMTKSSIEEVFSREPDQMGNVYFSYEAAVRLELREKEIKK
jgi:hypothetical protein